MALEIVFPALTYVGKANFHVNFEQIDSKCFVNYVRLAVSKEADRYKSRPLFPRKSRTHGRAKRVKGKGDSMPSLAGAHIPHKGT